MYLDTYGNEAINGWDGTAIEYNEDGGYIFAPQVGAGTKDSYNRFTGVVMGKDSGQDKIGLYGYQSGVNTFGLMQDGAAFFGAKSGGGQIIIDGTSATLSGGGGGNSSIGMTITLADLNPGGNTYAIQVGADKFGVTYSGVMSAIDAEISGVIYATTGRIGCSSKTSSDGWIIKTNRLYSGSDSTRVELNSDSDEDYAIWAGATSGASAASSKFAVSRKGALYAKEGDIGGWILKSTSFSNTTNKIGMASSGGIVFWSGADKGTPGTSPDFSGSSYFYVTSAGKLCCKNADISGKITADSGTIGGWTITSSALYAGDTYLNATGQIVAVNANISGTINADSGKIGGWSISSNALVNGDTTLTSDGIIQTKTIYITKLGNEQNVTGKLGDVEGEDGDGTTHNLGLYTSSGGKASIILDSGRNIALKVYAGHAIVLGSGWKPGDDTTSELRCVIKKENQYGIYAQFA